MVHDGPTSAADTPEAGKLGHLRDFTSPDLSSIHPASTGLPDPAVAESGRGTWMPTLLCRGARSVTTAAAQSVTG
jgi:hypothetical protein